jgi:hypothetical protein
MTAILFSWIGYFLGNYFPFLSRTQKRSQVDKPRVDFKSLGKGFKKITAYFSDEGIEETSEDGGDKISKLDSQHLDDQISMPKLKELTHIWYDNLEQKLYAEIDGDFIDLDEKINPEQHGILSFLLLDFQDKIGITASLRSIIAERAEEAFPEENEEELVRPSFHPIKSLINYVQADVPKLEDDPERIPFKINKILQEKLKGTPLESMGISISEWPDRGVVFIVGLEVYNEIHQIPDSKIRLVIQEAVKEWENIESND